MQVTYMSFNNNPFWHKNVLRLSLIVPYLNISMDSPSFVGHYVPQLAELVYERNKNRKKYPYINLKGFIVQFFFLLLNIL